MKLKKKPTTKSENKILLEKGEEDILSLAKNLKNLVKRNKNIQHQNYKLYFLLCDPFTFINAYKKIRNNKGSLTKGVDEAEEIMQSFSLNKAKNIAQKFKNNSYKWKPVRRQWIPKPGKTTMRPIDTPTQEDRIVQEALRGIIESIFEPEFREFESHNKFTSTNFGFRPNKSTWEAVNNIKTHAQRTIYVIEGDIKGAYNCVNHKILLNELKTRIKDKKFIQVITDCLQSGIMDENRYEHTLKGTPQGGIVSPLLFNIYMFKFDKYMYENFVVKYQKQSDKKIKKQNPLHKNLGYQIEQLSKSIKKTSKNNEETKNILKKIRTIRNKRLTIPSYIISSLPITARFLRYADDWVLLLTCTKQESIKSKL